MWGSASTGSPWGQQHTPLDGLVLISKYFLRLQTFLFEASAPSLLPGRSSHSPLGVGPAGQPVPAGHRVGFLAVLYFAYWHDGPFLGPRFFYPLLPVLVLWTARLPDILESRFGTGTAYWTAVYGAAVALLLAVAVNIPLRARSYANSFTTLRWDADSAAAAAGVEGALVVVRESWARS